MLCAPTYTVQELFLTGKVKTGITTDEVLEIMGEPILSELDRTIEEWHYCDTAEPNIGEIQDTFVALFYVNNKLIAKKYDGSAKRGPGRPRIMREIEALIGPIAQRNPGLRNPAHRGSTQKPWPHCSSHHHCVYCGKTRH